MSISINILFAFFLLDKKNYHQEKTRIEIKWVQKNTYLPDERDNNDCSIS
jgi:hypothetical protein